MPKKLLLQCQVRNCVACHDTKATLKKIDKDMFLCMNCNVKLWKTGKVKMKNGGHLELSKKVPGLLIFVPENIIVESFIELPEVEKPEAIITIYDSPEDFKGKFVARLFMMDKPTKYMAVRDDLESIRQLMPSWKHCIPRMENDPKNVVEVWV